jgi:putative SOS response-associated peptidase YedK
VTGETARQPFNENVAPTNDCTVVRRHPDTGARHLDLLKRGLLRRCLVPADAFYEWKAIEGWQAALCDRAQGRPADGLRGLCESFRWPDETVTRSFTILTTTPNAEMADLHDRMPVILERQDWPTWLGGAEGDHGALLHSAPDGLLRVWPVDRGVGSPRNNGPERLESVAA